MLHCRWPNMLEWAVSNLRQGLLSCIVIPLIGVLVFEGVSKSRGTAARTSSEFFDPNGDKWPRAGVM